MIVTAGFLASGCYPRAYWRESYEPMTDAERKAVAEHAEKILAATPRTLAGDDQDWDDAISEAHNQARRTVCRPVLREYRDYEPTGRWRYADEIAPLEKAANE